MRNIGLHLFASVKGGVGKSTLAVATAKLLSNRGRVPVVLDTDVLGSSLADGLDLQAPEVAVEQGLPDYRAAPTGRWLTLDKTREFRQRRKAIWEDGEDTAVPEQLYPPYINDALFFPAPHEAGDCRVDAMLWKHGIDDGVRYLPSSPIRAEASRAAEFVCGTNPEFAWVRRIAWLIDGLLTNDRTITDIVIDLPPGTWGITHETLVLAAGLGDVLPQGYPQWSERVQWSVLPTLVTTPDRNDRVLALEYWLYARSRVHGLRVLMNRTSQQHPTLRGAIRKDLPPLLRPLGVEDTVRFVPLLPSSLGMMFVQGDVELSENVRELERTLLGKEQSHA